jgi:hypothetical protein
MSIKNVVFDIARALFWYPPNFPLYNNIDIALPIQNRDPCGWSLELYGWNFGNCMDGILGFTPNFSSSVSKMKVVPPYS